MIRPTQLLKALKVVFTAAWYLNVVLAGSAILFQVVNLFVGKKMLLASFLGEFTVENKSLGHLNFMDSNWSIYMDELLVNPSLLIESDWSQWLILIYSILVLSVVLFYNYQLKELFVEMNQSAEAKELFRYESIKRFHAMSLFSLLVFVVGAVLSLLKLMFLKEIQIDGMVLQPVFDHQVFNLLWLAVGFYLIAIIFRTGLDLKQESELTI